MTSLEGGPWLTHAGCCLLLVYCDKEKPLNSVMKFVVGLFRLAVASLTQEPQKRKAVEITSF